MREHPGAEESLLPIIAFFVGHWILSVFFQTFYLHRYGAHRMFTMSRAWDRFFYLCTFVFQGSSFLVPRAYAILHRQHHAFSDTERDPHSPHAEPNFFKMMLKTKHRYDAYAYRREAPEARFEGGYPEWPTLDHLSQRWFVRVGWGLLYTAFYVVFAPHWWAFLLLPLHFVMGPIHGAIVNWCGHKYGYRNFANTGPDRSRNTLVFDFVTLGELFQNNHHQFGMAPDFAIRWFEIDPAWLAIRAMAALGIVDLGEHVQKGRWSLARTSAVLAAPSTIDPAA